MDTKDMIRRLRTEKGLSQDELAEKLFVTRQAVSRWENGETTPNTETLKQLSRLFDVSPVTYPAYQEADSGVRSMKAWQEARNSGALQNAINQRMARERLLTLLNA